MLQKIKNTKALGLVAVALSMVAMFALGTAESVVEGGADTLSDTLLAVAEYVLPLAAGIIAITVGWRLARKFFRV